MMYDEQNRIQTLRAVRAAALAEIAVFVVFVVLATFVSPVFSSLALGFAAVNSLTRYQLAGKRMRGE